MLLIIGEIFCFISEFGIPFDMNGQHAFQDGDFKPHSKVMNVYYWALERNLLSSTLWNYCSDVYSSPMFSNYRTPTHLVTDSMGRISVYRVVTLQETRIFRK